VRWAIAAVVATACSSAPDPWERLAKRVPAAAGVVVAIEGAKLRASWLGSSAKAVKALLPGDRSCVVDAAIESKRAIVAELASGRIVVVEGERGDCKALSQVESGIWIATLGGAQPPAKDEPPLRARPDWSDVRAAIGTAPIVAIAPDGEPAVGMTAGTLAIGGAKGLAVLEIDMESDERATEAMGWIHRQIESAAAVVGDAGSAVQRTTVTRNDRAIRVVLIPEREVAAKVGPQLVVAAIAAAATRRQVVATTASLACPPPAHGITCEEGMRFAVPAAKQADVIAALSSQAGKPRVEAGRIDGFRLGEVGDVVAALGLREGDIVRAIDDERVDDAGVPAALAEKFAAKALTVVIERDGETAELRYIVGD
jgi:hypothetical protein